MTKILIAGDFCPNARIIELIENEKYAEIFNEITALTKSSYYSIVNLECPVVLNEEKPIKKNGPNLKCTPKAVDAIQYAGFNMVTLANNHFYDYGDVGVNDTLMTCQKYGIDTVGGGADLKQAQEIKYKKIKEKQFAFINICEHEFSIATESTGGANPLNPISNYHQIQEARKRSDYVIIIVHGGHEYYQLPSPRMKETYRFFIDAGADAVINHHQHCYSGYEIYNGKPIFYGLGNFCFDWDNVRNNKWNEGYMVMIKFDISNISFEIYPYIQGDEKAGISIMTVEENQKFNKALQQINRKICDDKIVNEEHKKMINRTERLFMSAFEPYQNRYLKALYMRHLLPSLISTRRWAEILNYIECESHRDRIVSIINNILFKP